MAKASAAGVISEILSTLRNPVNEYQSLFVLKVILEYIHPLLLSEDEITRVLRMASGREFPSPFPMLPDWLAVFDKKKVKPPHAEPPRA